MLAQAGLDGAVGGIFGPLTLLWLMAVGYLLGLSLFGLFVAGIRVWHRSRGDGHNHRGTEGAAQRI